MLSGTVEGRFLEMLVWSAAPSLVLEIGGEPVQFTGFKLFYKNDKPLMTPEQVLEVYPKPMYIQYQ